MLPEEVKQQIRLEELYRDEVRRELNTKKKNKYWEFINSSFGIWLLSSVVIALITWGYTQISQSIADSRKNRTELRKYDIEIEGRFQILKSRLQNLQQNANYFDAIMDFSSGNNGIIFNEYRGKGVRSLLLEQFILTSGKKEKKIESLIRKVDSINVMSIGYPVGIGREEIQAPIADSLLQSAKKIVSLLEYNMP